MPLQAFPDHDQDRYFVEDRTSHPSQKGWVYFDETLEAFYHGALG